MDCVVFKESSQIARIKPLGSDKVGPFLQVSEWLNSRQNEREDPGLEGLLESSLGEKMGDAEF